MASLSDRLSGPDPAIFENPNLIINGAFEVWQRGVDFPSDQQVRKYTADMWRAFGGSSVRRSDDVPNKFTPYSLEIFDDGLFPAPIFTAVELTNPQSGAAPFTPDTDYTLSFWAKRSENQRFSVLIQFANTLSYNTGRVIIYSQDTAIAQGGVWGKFEATFNIGSLVPNVNNTIVAISLGLRNAISNESMFLALVKLETSSEATAFVRAGSNLAGELAMCQRYYQNSFMGTGKIINSGATAIVAGPLPVTMRIPPIVTLGDNVVVIDDIGVSTNDSSTDPFVIVSKSSASMAFTLDTPATDGNQCGINTSGSMMHLDSGFDEFF